MRILVELHHGEIDVNGLQKILGISHSGVSQNLSILRAHHLVRERREGRRVFYSLTNPRIAEWLIEGLEFLAGGLIHHEDLRNALQEARQQWTGQKES